MLVAGTSGKELSCQYRIHKRHGFNPWVRKIPWMKAWQPTPEILAWRIPMYRGTWQAIVHRMPKSETQLKQLRTHACADYVI